MGIPPTRFAAKTICIDATAVETEGLGLLAEPSLPRVKERAGGQAENLQTENSPPPPLFSNAQSKGGRGDVELFLESHREM